MKSVPKLVVVWEDNHVSFRFNPIQRTFRRKDKDFLPFTKT